MAPHPPKVTRIRGRVKDRLEMEPTLNCADIRCLKIIQDHLHGDQRARGQYMESGTMWRTYSTTMIADARDPHEEKAEAGIPIAIGKITARHRGIEVEAVPPTSVVLRIVMLYSRGFLLNGLKKMLAAPFPFLRILHHSNPLLQ